MNWFFILGGAVLVLLGIYQMQSLSRKRFLRNLGSQIKYLIARYFV